MAAIVIPITIVVMFANDHLGIRTVYASGNACSIVADLTANLFGAGGMREREPHCGRRDAKQNLACDTAHENLLGGFLVAPYPARYLLRI